MEEKNERFVKENDKRREGNDMHRLEEERAEVIAAKMEDIRLTDFNQVICNHIITTPAHNCAKLGPAVRCECTTWGEGD